MLTRIIYFAIGMLDVLPPAPSCTHYLSICEARTPKTIGKPMDKKKGLARNTRSQPEAESSEEDEEERQATQEQRTKEKNDESSSATDHLSSFEKYGGR